MARGVIDKTLELQIADIAQRTLDDHQGALTLGPIRVRETDDMVTGEWYLHIYIVVDGDYELLYHDLWNGSLPLHIEPELRAIGVTQFVLHSLVGKEEWTWFHKAARLDF